MENTLISFETAKLAKQKGFREKCFAFYFMKNASKKSIKTKKLEEPRLVYTEAFFCVHESEERSPGLMGGDSQEYYTRCIPYQKLLRDFNDKKRCLREWHSAPTQSFLQKWLREKHSIHIVIQDAINMETRKTKYYPVLFPFGKQYDSIYGDLEDRNDGYVYLGDVWKESYEEALEVGLLKALELIKS